MQAPLASKHHLLQRRWERWIKIFTVAECILAAWFRYTFFFYPLSFPFFLLAKYKSVLSFYFYIQFCFHSFVCYLFCFYFIFFWLIFFFNFIPHHLVSFNFFIKFYPHSFKCYLFIFLSFFYWILFSISSLSIWFWFIFMSNLVPFLFIAICFVWKKNFIDFFLDFIPQYFVIENFISLFFRIYLTWC